MSSSEVERFLTDLQNDAGLRQELENLGQDTDACVRWANAKGYAFTREEAQTLGAFETGLSDDDLEQVAGGWCGNESTIG
jgi:predicted ribosomally synthesized peptide with nif11-like leader